LPSILPLALADVTVERDGRRLLAVARAVIAKGRRTVVLGPNGAGKTLFLKLCHGLIAPSSGTVRFAAETGARRHAMVFQKPVMLRRSVMGNMTHALAAGG
ncbi:ATP-binding cassette domain-containing protein, partial [Mycobacterium tuberculosis]|nr:ATP-binding cassette domain-containing protein [Mycobacterium tuberculosis]